MARSYWLVNSNRSEVRRFTKNVDSPDRFKQYVFVDSGKIIGTFGKDLPIMQKREEFVIEEGRDIWKKLLAQGWRRTEPVWDN